MKAFSYHFLVLALSYITCHSQNFVNNHSFELMHLCPNGYAQIDSCIGWATYGSTPDYFNICGAAGFNIPDNFLGYQPAFDGNGYSDVITYSKSGFDREYIGTELITPLQVGKRYFVSCYVCRANDFTSNAASNNIGFRFFNQSFSYNNPCPTDNFANVYSPNLITDSINWTKIEGSFVADSAYQYLAIGNFFDDQHTDTADFYSPWSVFKYAQYYIDYVCVTADPLMNCDLPLVTQTSTGFKRKIDVSFNYSAGILEIVSQLTDLNFEATNSCGEIVISQKLIFGSNLFDFNLLNSGLYFIHVRTKFGECYTKKIAKQ